MVKRVIGNSFWGDFIVDIFRKVYNIFDYIAELNLFFVKFNRVDLIDVGLGVGVFNYEVRFRDVEFVCIYRSDYRVRVYFLRGDSE